jgi:hypothetical protein
MNLHTETNINDFVQHHFFHPSVHFTTKLDLHLTHSTRVYYLLPWYNGKIHYHFFSLSTSLLFSSSSGLFHHSDASGWHGIRHRVWHGMVRYGMASAWNGVMGNGKYVS